MNRVLVLGANGFVGAHVTAALAGLFEPWVLAAYALYGVTGLFWLPVVWIQMRLTRPSAGNVR